MHLLKNKLLITYYFKKLLFFGILKRAYLISFIFWSCTYLYCRPVNNIKTEKSCKETTKPGVQVGANVQHHTRETTQQNQEKN